MRVPCESSSSTKGYLGLTMSAYAFLVLADLVLLLGGFPRLYKMVAAWPTRERGSNGGTQRLLAAFDRAMIAYFKRVRCLQEAAAAACYLRSHGMHAVFAIGTSCRPFYAHAWVELGDEILVGGSKNTEYFILDRI